MEGDVTGGSKVNGYHIIIVWGYTTQMELQREKNRIVELTNETKKFKELKKVKCMVM